MSLETWLPVVGYVGLYEVSDLGRVRSVDRVVPNRWGTKHRRKGKLLQPGISKDGYRRVRLFQRGKAETIAVHRLVLLAFRGPCPTGEEARHGRNGQGDNSLANLSWGTHAENTGVDKERDGTAARLSGEANGNAILTWELVREIRARADSESHASIFRDLVARGVPIKSKSHVSQIVRGEVWREDAA